jgi:Ca2+-binding RTX toxin-like protein
VGSNNGITFNGTTSISSSVNYVLPENINTLELTGNKNITGTANNNGDTLISNDALSTLVGGSGNDTYVINNSQVVIVENTGWGTDNVQSNVDYTLGANLENLSLLGTAAINGTGNTSNNAITGNSGDNILDGGVGTDTLTGGLGNDTYLVDLTSDVVVENANQGIDTVQTALTYTLGTNVENLKLTGTNAVSGTGNSLDNSISGNSAANTLTGGAGNDTLDGGAGNDSMIGGIGNDVYGVDSTGDIVVENANEGTDTVQSSIAYTLSTNLENLTLTGTANINGTGNASDNVLVGNSGNNSLVASAGNDILNGGIGADTMIGGAGNDIYYADNSSDITTENASEGTDTVIASVAWGLGSNLENLTLSDAGGAIDGDGNSLNNLMIGNIADNFLDGFDGNDTLNGGLGGNDTLAGDMGDDTFIVDRVGITIYEWDNQGIDTVQSSIDYTLGDNGLENLTLTGTANLNGAGNNLDNMIIGNIGNNILDGSGGADTLIGGLGNDIYIIQNNDDVVTELANQGADSVEAYFGYGLTDNVENLTLAEEAYWSYGEGNALDNILTGNSSHNDLFGDDGNDTLIGSEGDDNLYAGFGNDVYRFSAGDGNDVVTENGGTLDTIAFDSSVTQSSIGLYQDSYGNLQFGYGSFGDVVTIQEQGTTDGNIERFQLSDGAYMTDADVNLVIQQMSSYATSHSASFSSLSDVENNSNLLAIVNSGWHH